MIRKILGGIATLLIAHTQPAVADKGQWDQKKLEQLTAKTRNNDFKHITSIVIQHNGKLVYEEYFNDGSRNKLNDLRSATKSVTSLLVGIAIDKGYIKSVKQKVYDYYPAYRDRLSKEDPRRDITIEDLLTMSSIWECDDNNHWSAGHEERQYVTPDWTHFALTIPVRGYAPWVTKPEDSPYGRTFSYCSAGSYMLGAIVEKVSKLNLEQFSNKYLHRPLDIRTVNWKVSPTGIRQGGGGTGYHSVDFLKIGEMVMNDGKYNDKQIVSKQWLSQSLKDHVQAQENVLYGYQWWNFPFKREGKEIRVIGASGNGGNYLFISPENKLVTVITTTYYNNRNAHPQSQKIYQEYILNALAF